MKIKVSEYKEKANLIIERLDKCLPYEFCCIDEYEAVKRDFEHLVFAFNERLPMYIEMMKENPCTGLQKLNAENIREYALYFIKYLDEFHKEDE